MARRGLEGLLPRLSAPLWLQWEVHRGQHPALEFGCLSSSISAVCLLCGAEKGKRSRLSQGSPHAAGLSGSAAVGTLGALRGGNACQVIEEGGADGIMAQ